MRNEKNPDVIGHEEGDALKIDIEHMARHENISLGDEEIVLNPNNLKSMPVDTKNVPILENVLCEVENTSGEVPKSTENQEQINFAEVEYNEDALDWLVKELASPFEVEFVPVDLRNLI